MSVCTLSAAEALSRLGEFDAIVDARTPAEFALDHVPGAVNWPTLSDEERVRIGTMYKQVSAFEAKKHGAALAARNISLHIEAHVLDKPKSWRPLVYCWRGGNRSGSLATVLGAIGFAVTLLEGGYKAWRAALVADLDALPQRLRFEVLCGATGSGKTRLLHALKDCGAQTLDLEGLAEHRSSVLGWIPGRPQPSQKHFETRLWQALRQLDASRPVFVESESKKVGNLRVPEVLMQAMRTGRCWHVQLPLAQRVALLMEDYPHLVHDPDGFGQRLLALTPHRGHSVVAQWLELVRAGETAEVVRQLLAQHYDPTYQQSTARNFTRFGQAEAVVLADRSEPTLREAAQALLRAAQQAG